MDTKISIKRLSTEKCLKIAAPMVRYSKLAFRQTVRRYNADVCYTPMIMSDAFKYTNLSRQAELSTCPEDEPLIVQFAASNSIDAADAAELVAKYCSGVDINCGCPQSWAFQEGIGSFLLTKPELVQDIVDQTKRRTAKIKMDDGSSFPVSIKIRIDQDLRKTVDLCQRAEKMGADWITVHGRLKSQKNEGKANLEAIKIVKESLNIPVFGNGGIENLEQLDEMQSRTNCDGVMVAQGLLQNPAMFAGYPHTPKHCVEEFVRNSIGFGDSNLFIFQHHLMYMLESQMSNAEKKHFNQLGSIAQIIDYLRECYDMDFGI